MTDITNDNEFRQAIKSLDAVKQRVLAARFTENVLPLCDDQRVARAVKMAADAAASKDELDAALHSVKAAIIDCHSRCGAEGDWSSQAGYFVARAAAAVLSPDSQRSGGPAWQAAMSSRMARTCKLIGDAKSIDSGAEQEQQYRILDDFLHD